ncbi:MAG: hypothetical protein IPK99_11790 [Flavobacteriales bacterium]|nr:hypothetical protein [Flavobacteriales bacterium]
MKHWMTLVALVLCIDPASGQNAEQGVNALQRLDGFSFTVLYSAGHEERARAMAQLCERTMVYMDGQLDFIPALQLKVLAQVDWSAHTAFPVYGMPHPVRDTTLVLAAEDNDFWRSFVPDTAQLPGDLVIQVRSAYGTPDGGLSMQPFFDLLVLHELAHLYHLQRPWTSHGFGWASSSRTCSCTPSLQPRGPIASGAHGLSAHGGRAWHA